jgi:putative tryptophan/tyrosine transport system substrate-binding protein
MKRRDEAGKTMKRREFAGLLAGATAAISFGARAQQRDGPIGFLHQGFAEPPSNMNAFRKGLSEAGIDSQAVTIEDRAANGHYDQLPALAAELVAAQVKVIAANFLPAALAAKAATQTIPVVFLSGSDPIKSGLVSSLNRPDGNVTGIATMFTLLGTKNLELLHQLVPGVTTIGVLANLTNPNAEHQLRDLNAAARLLGQEVVVFPGSNKGEVDTSFAAMHQRKVGAFVVTADGFLINSQDHIVALAARYAIPAMYPLSQYASAGGLMSYGANLRDAFRQMGIYVGKVLKGMKPADLPVLQPTKVEFVINLKTARTLGIDVPPNLLALADEVIE